MAKGLPKTANVTRWEGESDEKYTIRRMVALARFTLLGGSGDLYPPNGTRTTFSFPEGIVTLCGDGDGYAAHAEYWTDTGKYWHIGLGRTVGPPSVWGEYGPVSRSVPADYVMDLDMQKEEG